MAARDTLWRPILLALFALGLAACGDQNSQATQETPADLVMFNGGIYTVNPEQAWVEAVAVRDGKIIALGDNSSMQALAGPDTRLIDLAGKMALPGFHDAHAHPIHGGQMLEGCSLYDKTSEAELLTAIAECRESEQTEWLEGHSFDLSMFGQDGPHKSLLDAIDSQRPMIMWAADGHNAWANSAALELAGITASTPDPEHGVIERDPDGSPSGTLRETAQNLMRDAIPPATERQRLSWLRAAQTHLNAYGITSVIDAWVGEEDWRAYQALDLAGELNLRVRTSLTFESSFTRHPGEEFAPVLARRNQYESTRVNNDAVKIFVDGVLEGETAALLHNYTGMNHAGELILTPEQLSEAVTRFDAEGLQVHMHAIGDRAVRAGLDAIEAARGANGPGDNRHHISHLQLIDVDDIERFGALGVTANFQAAWAYPDEWIMDLNLPVVGAERVQGMYPIASVERAGGRIAGGSDWNVSTPDPLYAIETALRRQDADADDEHGLVLNESERVSLATMIEAYTLNGAWLMHREEQTGSIEVGKNADFAILDRNLFQIPVTEINQARVLETLLEGITVYQHSGQADV